LPPGNILLDCYLTAIKGHGTSEHIDALKAYDCPVIIKQEIERKKD
jgi:hypothetical protein